MRWFVLFLVLASFSVRAQVLLESALLETYDIEALEARLGEEARTGISLYKINYLTTGTDGLPDTASGLAVIPDEFYQNAAPMVAYQHGTTDGPDDVPSRLTGGSTIPMAYGGQGYIVSAADYLGLGDSRGFHPFVHAATQASAGIDMLLATQELYEELFGQPWSGQLFISGYSQGGHAAAALQRELEEHWDTTMPVTASTPMSGPYSLSGVMFDLIVSDEVYFYGAFIVYVILGYQEVYGNLYDKPEDLFKPQYITAVNEFYLGNVTLSELGTFLVTRLFFDNGAVKPKFMFKDSVLQEMTTNPDHPLRVALRANDLYNWVPHAPTRLLYCSADEVVPYENSIVADSFMQANAALDVVAIDVDPEAGHGGCGNPAVRLSAEFFDGFVLSSSTANTSVHMPFSILPNPAATSFSVKIIHTDAESIQVTMYNASGQILKNWVGPSGQYDISDIVPGAYLIRVRDGMKSGVERIIIQ